MHCVEKHALVSSDALVSSYSLVSYISYTSMQACERMLLSVSCVCASAGQRDLLALRQASI